MQRWEHKLNRDTEAVTDGPKTDGEPRGTITNSGTLVRRLQRACQRRFLPLWLALLGMTLALPALRVGLLGDDLYHKAVLRGERVFNDLSPSPWNMFLFMDGDASRTRQMIDMGVLPWFTWPGVKGAFWRPLTVATHWLDYRLWPDRPELMHAQSILWFGAVIVVVTLFYRRVMLRATAADHSPGELATGGGSTGQTLVPWAAGLAALLYTVDDARGLPVGFLANRNTLICTFFGVLALLAHDAWRRGAPSRAAARRPGLLPLARKLCIVAGGPVLLTLSLLAKEEGVGVCAYLFAYAVFLDRAPWRQKLLTLTPYLLVVVVWRVIWTGLGFGVEDLGFYVDPLRDPARFLWAALQRAPIALLGQWGLPPAEVTLFLGKVGWTVVWLFAVGILSVVAWLLYPVLRKQAAQAGRQSDTSTTHSARLTWFWLLGMLLAVVPVCTTFPADRMLAYVGLGAMGLLAQFFTVVAARGSGSKTRAALTGGLVGVHLVIAPIMLPLRAGWPAGPDWDRAAIRTPLDERIADQDLVLVNPPSVLHVAFFLPERNLAGLPVPRHIRQLAGGIGPCTVERLDERTLQIRPRNGYVGWAFEGLFRTEQRPFKAGDRITLTGMSIDITEVTRDGRPAVARFDFNLPLEDASLRWLVYEGREFRPFVPPPVGEPVELAGWKW